MVEYARANNKDPRIGYVHLDARNVSVLRHFHPSGFTHVMSFFTFHWLEDYQ
jgi:hypothetical protein